MRCEMQAGRMMRRYGQDLAPASRSALRENRRDLMMNATFGLHGSGSLSSASLQSSLGSKLRARSIGSILYRLTWKARVTPSGRAICALRASAARISASDFILSGWPTPQARDHFPAHSPEYIAEKKAQGHGMSNLNDHVTLAGWQTPKAQDGAFATPRTSGRPMHRATHLQTQVTAQLTDNSDLPPNGPMRLCSDGTLLTGCSAVMENGGRLNPAHSRWLMRLPPEWDACAPTETRSTRKPRANSAKPSPKSQEYDL